MFHVAQKGKYLVRAPGAPSKGCSLVMGSAKLKLNPRSQQKYLHILLGLASEVFKRDSTLMVCVYHVHWTESSGLN